MILQGGRKWDGLAVNGDTEHPDTQVPTDKLVMRNYTNAGYRIEPPFFFCPPTSHTWHKGVPSFLTGEGSQDAIVTMGGTQTLYMSRRKSDK